MEKKSTCAAQGGVGKEAAGTGSIGGGRGEGEQAQRAGRLHAHERSTSE